jgi:putative transposase
MSLSSFPRPSLYYVATVGERANWDTVAKYVAKQGKPRTDLRQLKLFE